MSPDPLDILEQYTCGREHFLPLPALPPESTGIKRECELRRNFIFQVHKKDQLLWEKRRGSMQTRHPYPRKT